MGDEYAEDRAERPETIGLLIDWNHEPVSLFLEQANARLALGENQIPQAVPNWFRLHLLSNHTERRVRNEATVMTGIAAFLKDAGSRESFGSVLIASNTLIQYTKIVSALCVIERDTFMQDCMNAARRAAPNGSGGMHLASLALISSKTRVYGQPIGSLKVGTNSYNNLFN